MKNGQIWLDTDGNPIQAHGGCIIEHKGTYYWYGEFKGVDNYPGKCQTPALGMGCYSSKDLVNWKNEGLAFETDKENSESPMHISKVFERPKVIYNEKTDKFIMWAHIDSKDYTFAATGIAVSDSPTGPFKFVEAKQPNRQDCRDMTIFKDVDGTAYLVHSTDWNKTLDIARLNDTYTDVDGLYVSVMKDQLREAPALVYHNGMYYMVTSGCSGWNPNSALFSICPNLLGQWKLIDNPCEGPNYRQTFFGQSTYIFSVNGKDYIMFDHWKPNDLKTSGYSILPISYDEAAHTMTITWQDEWNGI